MQQDLNLLEAHLETLSERHFKTRSHEIKRILEALLFSTNEALSLTKLKEIVSTVYPITSRDLETLIHELGKEYQKENRSFQIEKIAEGYLMRTVESMSPFTSLLHQDRRKENLSHAAREVLAITAYRQPITRREIEGIRGVDSSGTIASLLEKGLIEPVGRKEAPGKPIQYGVTKSFLQHFGLKNRQELTHVFNS